MSFLVAGAAVISAGVAVAQMIQGNKQAKQARIDAAKSKAEMQKSKDMFESMDTTNPYLNMENAFEDLTVNQQAAEFQRDQQMQNQANIMQQMRGAAGGSGIAALAQTMAQQGSRDAQQASASIAQQEAAIQQQVAGEQARLQGLEREGEGIKRSQQFGKIQGMMGIASGELAGARSRLQAGQEAMMTGAKGVATAGYDYLENEGYIAGDNIVDGQWIDRPPTANTQ
tara:strand:+ start:370 stop:1050 length:681 start_codon:yes stop_codon:yes gene_type:complete